MTSRETRSVGTSLQLSCSNSRSTGPQLKTISKVLITAMGRPSMPDATRHGAGADSD